MKTQSSRAMMLQLAAVACMALAPAAALALPSGLAHVDPRAPCFRWPAVDMDGDGVFDRIDHCPSTPKGCTVDQWGCSSDADGDGVCDGLDLCPGTPAGTKADEHGCPGGTGAVPPVEPPTPPPSRPTPTPAPTPTPPSAPVSEPERQLLEHGSIRLENVYFETGSARLLPESESALDEAGRALEKYPDLEIEVEGHTDTRGAARYNMRLSQQRAETVRVYLLKRFDLKEGNISAKGYGEEHPETRERNQEELLRNRRVVLRVLNPDALPSGVKVEKK